MNIACFTMLKDEESIIEPFCDQLNEFFDISFIVDHSSLDGSARVVKDKVKGSKLFKLISGGYPQAELANIFTKIAFEEFDVDYLFFLDCDEYLPFSNRDALGAELTKNPDGYFVLNWRNVVPIDLNGGGNFAGGFLTSKKTSSYTKVAISKRMYLKHPSMSITQGYHTVIGIPPDVVARNISSVGLFHVPVPFREKYLQKIKSSSASIRSNDYLIVNRLGAHWVEHDDLNKRISVDDDELVNLAIMYPEINLRKKVKTFPLGFDFPYVKSKYRPEKMLRDYPRGEKISSNQDFVILAEDGSKVFDSKGGRLSVISTGSLATNSMRHGSRKFAVTVHNGDGGMFDPVEVQDKYVAPLFSLPRKLPVTAWTGHIPFLFVLFRNLRPRCYVDLGVHFGASLIAAATAAQAYDTKTSVWGVDTWEGDVHAGRYEGDRIYEDLLAFLDRSFQNVHLVRSTFDSARASFNARPIDLLHIDGLHTYEAVKSDYENWLPAMSERGVIIFHDTNVRERDFGVWRLWAELKTKFPSLEFMHSHGLGVLFVGEQSLSDPYLKLLVGNEPLFDAYRATVSQIAELLPLRSAYLTAEPDFRSSSPDSAFVQQDRDVSDVRKQLTDAQWALQHYKNQLQSIRQHYEGSTSWKVTMPLRYIKRLIGG